MAASIADWIPVIAAALIALPAILNLILTMHNGRKLSELHVIVNGTMHEMLESMREQGRLEGVAEGGDIRSVAHAEGRIEVLKEQAGGKNCGP